MRVNFFGCSQTRYRQRSAPRGSSGQIVRTRWTFGHVTMLPVPMVLARCQRKGCTPVTLELHEREVPFVPRAAQASVHDALSQLHALEPGTT